jgi:hypothetical protein
LTVNASINNVLINPEFPLPNSGFGTTLEPWSAVPTFAVTKLATLDVQIPSNPQLEEEADVFAINVTFGFDSKPLLNPNAAISDITEKAKNLGVNASLNDVLNIPVPFGLDQSSFNQGHYLYYLTVYADGRVTYSLETPPRYLWSGRGNVKLIYGPIQDWETSPIPPTTQP